MLRNTLPKAARKQKSRCDVELLGGCSLIRRQDFIHHLHWTQKLPWTLAPHPQHQWCSMKFLGPWEEEFYLPLVLQNSVDVSDFFLFFLLGGGTRGVRGAGRGGDGYRVQNPENPTSLKNDSREEFGTPDPGPRKSQKSPKIQEKGLKIYYFLDFSHFLGTSRETFLRLFGFSGFGLCRWRWRSQLFV